MLWMTDCVTTKVSVEAIDASTVMVVAKNGPIDVAYTASPEQLAREKRDREIAAANETRRQKEEALAEQKRQVEERRAEKQRSDETALISKRDQVVLKAYPDWQEIRDSDIFVAWLAEQRKETTDKLNSPKATDVIAVIKQYHVELPKFVNRYASVAPRPRPQPANPTPTTTRTAVPAPSPPPLPVPVAGQVIKDCEVCPEMVVIPAGSFEMGSNGESTSEKPVHQVNVNRFMLGRTEVTQWQWKGVMSINPSNFGQCGDDCPVEQVSWDEAQRYVQKLSLLTGKNYRLPSEAEWEFAARAGSQNAWSFGNSPNLLDNFAWYASNSGGKTHGVAQKPANAFGLHDMHGNVWEWVQDVHHSDYSGAPTDGSAWMTGGAQAFRVARGGSWFSSAENQRSASRELDTADQRNVGIGFRVARTLSAPVVTAVGEPNRQPSPNVMASTPPSSDAPLASSWVNFQGTEVARDSIARDGTLLRYTYRQYGSVIKAAVHCGTRQRSDIGRDGSMELKPVFPGTHQSTVLDYVCDVGRTG